MVLTRLKVGIEILREGIFSALAPRLIGHPAPRYVFLDIHCLFVDIWDFMQDMCRDTLAVSDSGSVQYFNVKQAAAIRIPPVMELLVVPRMEQKGSGVTVAEFHIQILSA